MVIRTGEIHRNTNQIVELGSFFDGFEDRIVLRNVVFDVLMKKRRYVIILNNMYTEYKLLTSCLFSLACSVARWM